jgi:hypothetical protein
MMQCSCYINYFTEYMWSLRYLHYFLVQSEAIRSAFTIGYDKQRQLNT